MPAALLPPSIWLEIRRASEQGVPDPDLCNKYQISGSTLRSRRSREKWMTPEAVHAEKERQRMDALNKRVATGTMQRVQQNDLDKGALSVVSERLTTLAEKSSLRFAELAAEALDMLPEIEITSASEACGVVKTLRTIAGMDKTDGVQVNIAAWGASAIRRTTIHDLTDE